MTNDQIRECYRSADPLYDKEFTGLKASASEEIRGLLQKSEFKQIVSDVKKIIINSKKYYLLEKEFEALADELINSKKIEDATEVLILASELFPGSAEVYTCLGELYLKIGNTDLAIINYEKSISIDPFGERSMEGIKKFKRSGIDCIKELLANSTFKDSEAEILKICANPKKYYFSEFEINNLGYQLLMNNRSADAIGVFEINTRFFPKSGNAFDSLGEAFMISGDTPSAIKNYEKSLDLNPGNSNAILMLKKLRKE
jgi:tetratricopeptide (TPR) repeat protein